MSLLAFLAASGAVMFLFAFLMDAAMSWGERVLFNRTFGFPKTYRIATDHPACGRARSWVNPRVQSLAGSIPVRVLASTTEEGLAVDIRSLFAFRRMQPVVIPWRALRLEVGPPPCRERTLVVLCPEGSVATSFQIMPFDLRWRDALAERIAAETANPTDPTHGPSAAQVVSVNTPETPGKSSGRL